MDNIGGGLTSAKIDDYSVAVPGKEWEQKRYISAVSYAWAFDIVCKDNQKYGSMLVIGYPYYQENPDIIGINAIIINDENGQCVYEIATDELKRL